MADKYSRNVRDLLNIENTEKRNGCMKVLVTGGGAFNTYLIRLFKSKIQGGGFDIEIAEKRKEMPRLCMFYIYLCPRVERHVYPRIFALVS
jgi:pantothenate kinase